MSYEFHNQASKEKAENLPFQAFMEPHPSNTVELAKLQIGFINFVVDPFWVVLNKVFKDGIADRVEQLKKNKEFWENEKKRCEERQESTPPRV